MVLVGPSLGGAVAIDFALAHPDAVSDFSPLPDLATFLHLAPHMVLYCMEVLYVSWKRVQIAKLVLVNAQAYTEGVGEMATLPKLLAYMGVCI